MKSHPALSFIFVCVISSTTFTAFSQNKDKKDKSESQNNRVKGHFKKGEPASSTVVQNNKGSNRDKIEQKEDHGKDDLQNGKSKGNGKEDKGKKEDIKVSGSDDGQMAGGYHWNPETFKERKKLRDEEKVILCHKFSSKDDPAVTISVSSNAVKAHLKHGDVEGNCPVVTASRFSNTFLVKRTGYYNSIQTSQEKLLYSRSIYDYALVRLTESRLQLATLKNNNMPLADIERKEATVVELQQNVSLLQTLIGVAADFVVSKL